jgi:hypothetical protein
MEWIGTLVARTSQNFSPQDIEFQAKGIVSAPADITATAVLTGLGRLVVAKEPLVPVDAMVALSSSGHAVAFEPLGGVHSLFYDVSTTSVICAMPSRISSPSAAREKGHDLNGF